jgi:hypothetical protein
MSTITGMHMGRSFAGTRIEDECPCPKAECGLISSAATDESCDQHTFRTAKTMRQAHPAAHCLGPDSY